ncbi:ABC transporter permease [Brachybacterium sp. UNK5269]|uniref:ABC transporter permease n=1 Tax=Brachybacterium sp. UNK5269 TaxID=3408576 RepID=UPI003BB197F4
MARPVTRPQYAQIAVLVAAMVFFLLPWISAAMFGFSRPGDPFTFANLTEVFQQGRAWESITATLLLAVAATVVSLVLLVPTLMFLHLRAPSLLRIADSLSVLPMVVPAVALVSGAAIFFRAISPSFLVSLWSLVPFYVVMSMPLVYRALDTGVRALDLRTLWSASSSVGANWLQTILRVVLPNMRPALVSAALLCFAMVLGEFAIASLLLHYTFPVFTVEVGGNNPRGAAALSVLTMIVTWILLVVISSAGRRTRTTRKASS